MEGAPRLLLEEGGISFGVPGEEDETGSLVVEPVEEPALGLLPPRAFVADSGQLGIACEGPGAQIARAQAGGAVHANGLVDRHKAIVLVDYARQETFIELNGHAPLYSSYRGKPRRPILNTTMLKLEKTICLLALGLAAALLCSAQASVSPTDGAKSDAASAAPKKVEAPARAFRGVELGMDRDTAIAALKKDPVFSYRGPEDLSLLPSPNQSLIEVTGLSFVKRGFFQFYEGKLWTMILELNPDKVDHYSVYTSLVAKYGEPALLDPKEARWEDKATRMAIERPLTLRYMDMAVYAKISAGESAKAGTQELDRQGFLGGL
jgi:hypothetical protein